MSHLPRCDLMLFENGIQSGADPLARQVSCDLMLFENGIQFSCRKSPTPFSCDLMLFENGIQYVRGGNDVRHVVI